MSSEYSALPVAPTSAPPEEPRKKESIIENVSWKETGILCVCCLGCDPRTRIGKNYTTTCSVAYWALDLLQIPVALGASGFQAVNLYKGRRVIASKGEEGQIGQCACGILNGVVGGLLGLGGGFILGPLFLELGIPPQAASATATFAMTFSSSMSVVEYYLLKRFPVPYDSCICERSPASRKDQEGKIKKGQVVRAAVVRAAMLRGRCDGSELKIDDSV
ncbi:hypothetical protein QQ045_010241 [Rhodiola kirilowii]